MPVFAATSLRVRYPAQIGWALDGIDLVIAPGEVTWLTGVLGSGASTLLAAIAGLTPRLTGGEMTGSMTADGVDTCIGSPLKRGFAYLSASPALQLSGIARTVREEIAVGPMNLGLSRTEVITATDAAIARVELAHLADRAPGELSGGETQQVLIASMLAGDPKAWLLDEPFAALDRQATARLRELLRELAVGGATVVVACDAADTMVGLAQRIIVLKRGRVACDGAPVELLAGDALVASGAGSTEAAEIGRAAGVPPPRPLDTEALIQRIERAGLHTVESASEPAQGVETRTAGLQEILQMDQVSFRYPAGPRVLKKVSLTVARGEPAGLFGPNGSGKSTMLRLVMALEQPECGRITTCGTDTTGRKPEDLAPRIGFLFQQPERQLFATSVRRECGVAARLAGKSEAETREAVEWALKALGLADTAEEHPYDLPLPQRRLVALASILSADPELVMLDEPTAALDTASRDRVIHVVQDLTRRGVTVLAITHDPVFAHEALQRGIVLERGTVVRDGTVNDVFTAGTLPAPAALQLAQALRLSPGHDRRSDVIATLGSMTWT